VIPPDKKMIMETSMDPGGVQPTGDSTALLSLASPESK
jgi:hypothetical protein